MKALDNCELNNLPQKLLFWGGGDQARVLLPIVESLGSKVLAVIDDIPELHSPFKDVDIFEGRDGFERWAAGRTLTEYGFVIAIGNPYGHIRCALHDFLESRSLQPVSFADPTAIVDATARIASGVQIMRGAIVNTDAVVGRQCIINSGAIVEHDDYLEDGVEIAPGATLCGRVSIGKNTWVCANATIKPRVNVGENSIIGAGSVVVNDIPNNVVAYGVPAKVIKRNLIDE